MSSSQETSFESRRDHKCHQFLEQELTCVWDVHHRNLRLATPFAFVNLRVKISLGEKTANVTNVNSILVWDIHSSLFQESGCSVRNHAVTLHFSESKTTVSRSTFSWLPCQDRSWTSSSRVHFVSNHMLQSLIVSRADENKDLLFLSSETIVHYLITVSLVTKVVQLTWNFRNLLTTERCCITRWAIKARFLG